jgi:hypothetical protein
MPKVLSVEGAGRLLGISGPMAHRLIRDGFLKKPLTPARVRAGGAAWEADKARRKAKRERPSQLAETLKLGRTRLAERKNTIAARQLVLFAYDETATSIICGPIKSDTDGLAARAASDGGDRAAIEARLEAILRSLADEIRAAAEEERGDPKPEPEPWEPPPGPHSVKDRHLIAQITKVHLALAELDDEYVDTADAIALLNALVDDVAKAFADVPLADIYIVEPMRKRAASVIRALEEGRDPADEQLGDGVLGGSTA